MDTNSKETKSSFLGRWILATAVGWVVGIIVLVMVAALENIVGLSGETAIGLGMGGAVGFLQWRVARKWFSASLRWMWGSLIGCAIPFIIYDLLSTLNVKVAENFGNEYWVIPLFVVFCGLLVGLLQQGMLRPYTIRANWWVLFSIAGWLLADLFLVTLSIQGHPETTVGMIRNLVAFPLAGLVQGLITGLSLKWLLTDQVIKA